MAQEDYKTVIKIEGDSAGAQSAIGRAANSLRGLLAPLTAVRTAIGAVMRAMGVFYLAMEGVRLVVNAFKSLREWLNRAAVAAKELQDRLANESAANAAAHAAEAYKKLNKELAEANRLERERNAILDARKTKERDLEDADAERSKQIEISKLDPASATYAEDKAAIERKYARQASETALARANQDTREGAQRLYAEADQKDREAAEVEKVYQRQLNASDQFREIRWRTAMEARNGDEDAQRKAEAADKQWQQSYDEAMRTKEAMEALRKEADSLRLRAGEMAGGSRAAAIRNEATQLGIDNQEREAAARKEQEAKREAERDAEASKKLSEKLATNEAADRWEREFAKASPAEKINMLQQKESSARNRFGTLQSALDEEMGKPVAERNQKRMAELRNGIEQSQGAMFAARRQREGLEEREIVEQIRATDDVASGIVSVAPSQSRLNAMGLGAGSGVQRVQQEMVNSLKDLVRLGRDQLAALKDIQNEDAGATFQ